MSSALIVESTLTSRYQTTIPELVRKALSLDKHDKVHYEVKPDGAVVMTRASTEDKDPVIEQFLSFLTQDMTKHPEQVQLLSASLVNRAQALVKGVPIALDCALSADDE